MTEAARARRSAPKPTEEQAAGSGLSLSAAMSGILALLAAEREERLTGAEPMKTELLLAQAGVPIRDIARILGKNYQAVQKVVWRARPVNAGRASGKESTNA